MKVLGGALGLVEDVKIVFERNHEGVEKQQVSLFTQEIEAVLVWHRLAIFDRVRFVLAIGDFAHELDEAA